MKEKMNKSLNEKPINETQSTMRSKAQPNRTNTKSLIGLISDSTGYLKGETEDILRGLTDVLQDELQRGNSVKIMGIGIFSPKVNSKRNFTLPSGEQRVSEGSMGVQFKADAFMNRVVNEEQGD